MRYIPKFQKGASIKRDISEKQAIVIANKIKNKQPISEKERQDYTNIYHKLASKGVDDKGEEYLNANLPEVEVTAKRIPYTQGLPTPYKLMSGYADMAGQVMNTPAAAMGELAHAVSGKDGEISRIVPQQMNPYSKFWQGDKGTPEQRSVSDAANIQNPVGRFVVDMITDPTTWVGVGAVKNIRFKNNIKKAADDYVNVIADPRTLERAKKLDLKHGTKYAEQIPNWLKNKYSENAKTGLYNISVDNKPLSGGVAYSSTNDDLIKKIIDRQHPDMYSQIHSDANYNKISQKLFNKPLSKTDGSFGAILRDATSQYDNLQDKKYKHEKELKLNNRKIVFGKSLKDDTRKANIVTSHELKHDLTAGNDLITGSQANEMGSFSHTYDDISARIGFAKADYYTQPTEIDAYLSTTARKMMVDKGILKNHFDELTPEKLARFKKEGQGEAHKVFNTIVKDESKYIDWFNKALPAAGTGIIANESLKDKKKLGGSISELGYKDNSPYKYAKQLPIYSANGTITMDNVSKPLMVTDIDNNETRILNPNSGIHQFEGNNFVEKPINNMIPNKYKPTDKLLWQEAFNKAKLKHGGYAQPNEIMNHAMNHYARKRGGWIMKAQGGGYNDPTTNTDYSGTPKPERNMFNGDLYKQEDADFENQFSGINPEIESRFAATATRLPANTQSSNPPAFNQAADASFNNQDNLSKYSNRTATSNDIAPDSEIFNRGTNRPMSGYPNSEQTPVYQRRFNTDYTGVGKTSESVENRTGGGERKGDKVASKKEGVTGSMYLNDDLRNFGYADESGNLTDKAYNALSEKDRAIARSKGMSAKDLLSSDILDDTEKQTFKEQMLVSGLGRERQKHAAYGNARRSMNETITQLERMNPGWRDLSAGEKQRLSMPENKNEFIDRFGDDLVNISNYRASQGNVTSRNAVVTANVDETANNKNRVETSGNNANKPNAVQGNEQGVRFDEIDYSSETGNNRPPSTNKPRTSTGRRFSGNSSRPSIPSRSSNPQQRKSSNSGGRLNQSEARATGNKESNIKTINTDLKGSTYTPKPYRAVGSSFKRQEGGYTMNQFVNNVANEQRKTPQYSTGQLITYQSGGEIKQGVVKFHDSSTGKLHLY